MASLILKWLFIAAAYLGPFGFVWVFRSFWGASGLKRLLVKLIYWPLMWIVGLLCIEASLAHHQVRWMSLHGGYPLTEEEMIMFGDTPNVAAGWVVTGWISILVAFLVGQYLFCKDVDVQKCADQPSGAEESKTK